MAPQISVTLLAGVPVVLLCADTQNLTGCR